MCATYCRFVWRKIIAVIYSTFAVAKRNPEKHFWWSRQVTIKYSLSGAVFPFVVQAEALCNELAIWVKSQTVSTSCASSIQIEYLLVVNTIALRMVQKMRNLITYFIALVPFRLDCRLQNPAYIGHCPGVGSSHGIISWWVACSRRSDERRMQGASGEQRENNN